MNLWRHSHEFGIGRGRMSYLLAECPSKLCRFECNRLEPLPYFPSVNSKTAVDYRIECPLCKLPLVSYWPIPKKLIEEE